MSRTTKPPIEGKQLQGFKYFKLISDLFDRLKPAGTGRDKAHNRQLFFDQYASLILLYYFSPIVQSLRGIQQLTGLDKVQKLLGVQPTALGSLSEAARVFDAKLLEPIIAELASRACQTPDALPSAEKAALAGLVAVDGSLLKALPRMAWALWQDNDHRAAKMHVAFAVFPHVPVAVTLTAANASERDEWRKMVVPGGFYVVDRGYADYSLLRELDEMGCRFVVRLQENSVYEVQTPNTLSSEAIEAGVVEDVLVRRLGTEKHNSLLERPLRIVKVQGEQKDHSWVLVTNDLQLSAELVAIAYRHRWHVELFFRWLKCVLGCRHLLSESENGVRIQVYVGIIAALLIGLWVGVKPAKRTYEMLCLYLTGWATEAEVESHLFKLRQKTGPPGKS